MDIENALWLENIFLNLLQCKSTPITEIGVKWFYCLTHRAGSLQLRGTAGKRCTWSSFDRNTIIVKDTICIYTPINFYRKYYVYYWARKNNTCCTTDKKMFNCYCIFFADMGCFGSKDKLSKEDMDFLKSHTRYDEATIKEWYKGFKVSTRVVDIIITNVIINYINDYTQL